MRSPTSSSTERAHDGVLRIMDFEREGVQLVAEGRIAPERGWVFPRWRVLVPLRITPAQSG